MDLRNRDFLIVISNGKGESEEILVPLRPTSIYNIEDALIYFDKVVTRSLDSYVDLYMLKEDWVDLDADNVEEFPIFTYEPGKDIYVLELGDSPIIIAIQELDEVKDFFKKFKIRPLKVYQYSEDMDTFVKSPDWMDFLEEEVISY